ncbi:MAG TPA: hypothetical protein VGS58_16935 [Candidatus Sulfopaludibacter sp.]|nr:hypothetical protein [Candidatus Sulfopaludibacter sp.]
MRITRFPSITEPQFLGCVSAFVDSLTGELNAAASALRRLEGKDKGAAFAYEMTLDTHRYGTLIVLDRWAALAEAFAPHLELSRDREILAEARARAETAEKVLLTANHLIDAADRYSAAIVEACLLAFQSLQNIFRQESRAAEQSAKLGPMLPEEFKEARRIFLEDLAAR